MQSIRRTFLALTTSLVALVVGSGPAFAGPAPLIEPDQGPAAEVGSSSSDGFLESWPPVTVAVLVAAAIVAIAVLGVSRLRHHTAATA
jgi:hypothetical protein